MLAGMVVGAAAGLALGERASGLDVLGDIFIRLLVLAAVPLAFFNLAGALASGGEGIRVGVLALRIGVYFLATTVAAFVLALAAIAIAAPGAAGFDFAAGDAPPAPGPAEYLTALIPDNLFGVFVDGRVTAVVILGLMIGIAARSLDAVRRRQADTFFDAATALFRQMVRGVLWFGPVGVAALMAASVGVHGGAVFGPLGRYLVAVWVAHLVFFGVHLLTLRFGSAWRPFDFLRRTATVWTTTASTCSSLASLGASLETAGRIGLPRRIYQFTLPLGAQFNKDGSAILLAAAFLFTAQAVGLETTLPRLGVALALGALLSAAAPGVPNGGIVNQALLVAAFGMPAGIVLLVAGVYRLVDIPTTTLNIMGDLVGTAVVSRRRRGEGEPPFHE